jgi:hypothetical protein
LAQPTRQPSTDSLTRLYKAYFASLLRAAQHMSAKPDTITNQSAIPFTTHLLLPSGLRMTFDITVGAEPRDGPRPAPRPQTRQTQYTSPSPQPERR